MSIFDLPGISKIALLHSLTQQNITSSFAVAGISPYNRDVFLDADFAPSYVTKSKKQNSNFLKIIWLFPKLIYCLLTKRIFSKST